jgi:GTPase involved in cell partitioning and DNA repair
MFGMWKIVAILAVIGAGIGYFKYTQDTIATLNQEIAKKDFALKADEATIAQQKADMAKQAEVQAKTFRDYQEARSRVDELQNKFAKHDLAGDAAAKPKLTQDKINKATDRTFKCIEKQINEGKTDAGC